MPKQTRGYDGLIYIYIHRHWCPACRTGIHASRPARAAGVVFVSAGALGEATALRTHRVGWRRKARAICIASR